MRIEKECMSWIGRLVVSLSLIGLAPMVLAQEQSSGDQTEQEAASGDLEEVIVTGSRIARAGVDTFYPAVNVSPEEFEDNAILNIADALNDVPGFNAGSSPAGLQNSYNVGQNFVNYLGLGSQRTLTVVNGRRFISSNIPAPFGVTSGLQVDYNILPMALIDRVEVIGVGGAPIYGSDAIAGTVNVIMKDRFEGMQFNGRYGTTQDGDGDFYGVSLAGGVNFSDNRGNVAVSIEHYNQDGLEQRDRDWLLDPPFVSSPLNVGGALRYRVNMGGLRAGVFTDGGLVGNPLTVGNLVDPTGLTFGAKFGAFPDGKFYQFDENSNLVPFTPGTFVGLGGYFVAGGEGAYISATSQHLQSPLERTVFTTRLNYDLTPNVRLFGDVLYAHSESYSNFTQVGFQTWLLGGASAPLVLQSSNPFLSDQARNLLAGAGIPFMYLHRSLVDIVKPDRHRNQDTWSFVGGAQGDFDLFDQPWTWEVYATYGESSANMAFEDIIDGRFQNAIQARRLTQADLALTTEAAILNWSGTSSAKVGDIVCNAAYLAAVAGGPPAGTNASFVKGCVPMNVFGFGVRSEESRDWVTQYLTSEGTNDQTVFNANVGGVLFDMPAGPLQFVIGYEGRKEEAEFIPGNGLDVQLGRTLASPPTGGSYDTDEFFGEVLVPIFGEDQGIPGLNLLELNGAVREIDNSIAGSATAWTLGGRWAPIQDIVFRANYTESVRAPSLVELFLPVTNTFSMANDPCDARFVNNGPDPANRRANCAAAIGPGYDPATFTSLIVGAIRPGRTGGNPDLLNETAESYSIGLTFQPTFWENFVFTADYINIELQDAISSLALTAIMDACYDAPGGGDVPPCAQFTRDAAGQIVDFQTGQTNASLSTVEVMNYMATYNLNMNSWGNLLTRLRLSNTLERELSVIGGVPTSDLGEFADPEWSGTLDLNWELANSLRFAYRLLWQPPSKFDSTGAQVAQYPTPADPTDNSSNIVSEGDTWWMSNLAVSYDFGPMLGNKGGVDTLVAQLAINNLFDHQPDTLNQAWLQYGLDEILGRQFSLSIQAGF